jgi:hypothetical protein
MSLFLLDILSHRMCVMAIYPIETIAHPLRLG